MKMQNESLLFADLFKQALSEWPRTLKLELETEEFNEIVPTGKSYDIVCYKKLPWNKEFDKYVVKDLFELCDDISEKYYGHPQELLMVNLHSKIFDTLWNLAKYVTNLELKHLRSDMVQQKLETLLNEGVKNRREDWENNDLQLIEEYFTINYPEKK